MKSYRLLWWSFFWRYFLYTQMAYALIGALSGFSTSFLHDPSLHELINEHSVLNDVLQGGIDALASSLALAQALKLHFPAINKQPAA